MPVIRPVIFGSHSEYIHVNLMKSSIFLRISQNLVKLLGFRCSGTFRFILYIVLKIGGGNLEKLILIWWMFGFICLLIK